MKYISFELLEKIESIIEGLQNPDSDIRGFALWRLSQLNDDSVIPYIIKGLNSCLQHQPNWGDGGCIIK